MQGQKRALSLIELLVVMAILAVIASSVLVAFSGIGNKKLDASARSLAAELMLVRQRAAGEHADFIVVFDTTAEKYTVYRDSVSSANKVEEKTLAVDIVSVTDSQVQFDSHIGTAEDCVVTLSSAGKSKTVTITQETGYIAIQ